MEYYKAKITILDSVIMNFSVKAKSTRAAKTILTRTMGELGSKPCEVWYKIGSYHNRMFYNSFSDTYFPLVLVDHSIKFVGDHSILGSG